MVVASELVDFIQHKQRVARARFLQVLKHTSRHGPDVGFPVSADFGFVAQASEAHADVFAAERLGDAFAEGCLAHAGRTVQAKNGRFQVAFDFQHRKVFDDALLDFFEAIVVLVEHSLGVIQVKIVLRHLVPRQVEQRLEVIGLHAVFAGLRVHPLELADLFVECFLCVVGPVFGGRFGALFEDLLFERVGPELVLDGLHLLMQEELALLLIEVGFDLALNVLLQGQHLLLLVEQFEDFLSALTQIDFFEDALFVLHFDLHVAADEIHQEAQTIDPLDGLRGLRRDVGVHLNELGRQVPQAFHHGLAFLFRKRLVHTAVGFHFGFVVGLLLDDLRPPEALLALQNDGVGAVRHLEHFQDAGHRSDLVEVVGSWNFGVVFFLADDPNQGLGLVGFSDQAHASVAAHADGDDHAWKEHGVAQGQQRQHFRHLFFLHGSFILFRQDGNEILVLDVAQSHGLLHLSCHRSKRVPRDHRPLALPKSNANLSISLSKSLQIVRRCDRLSGSVGAHALGEGRANLCFFV